MLTTSAPSPPPHLSSTLPRNAVSVSTLRPYALQKSPSHAAAVASSPTAANRHRSPLLAPKPCVAQQSSTAGNIIAPGTNTITVDADTQAAPKGGDPATPSTTPGTSAKRKEPSEASHGDGGVTLETAANSSAAAPPPVTAATAAAESGSNTTAPHEAASPSNKRVCPSANAKKEMPRRYESCDVRDLVQLIAAMLMELIRFNDAIPLADGRLTRFHSRAPPGISVLDYLQRLTTHATLSPPLLLSMVYYIDRLCSLYPAFTISSLTVHRFLIASATVASKGLSDLFWTNTTYARVGGISLKELKVLELEFLTRVEWRIVPQPEVLEDYYRSLIARSDDFVLETEPESMEE